ncbi:MAG TPA: hypothetical protein VIM07_07070 [Chitinophagaceae bacterium]
MSKSKTHKANLKLASLWQKAAYSAIIVNSPDVELTPTSFKKTTTANKKLLVPTDFVMIEPFLFSSLKAGERKVVVQILEELKRNNALWSCEYRLKGRLEGVISRLRELNILFKTDDLTMHIVNPWLIRRGTIPATVVATTLLVENCSELDPEMVRDLRVPNKAQLNGFYALLAE